MTRARLLFIPLFAGLVLSACRDGARDASQDAPAPRPAAPAPGGKYGDFSQIFADVAERALPSVVSVSTERMVEAESDPFGYFFGESPGDSPRREGGLGSGVITGEDGTILTNNHVIEGADRIRVQLNDGREFEAKVVGADPPSDLAVIRLSGPASREKFPAMPLGDSDKLRVGEWVIAVGSPYGLSHTVTTGIISAKGRHNTGINGYEDFLQTDAAINPGNSGGALLNLRGELIGINTAIFSRSGGYQGIGFAIPIAMARKIAADLVRDGEVTRGWLGVSIQPLDPALAEALGAGSNRGALVGGVLPGSPAEKAGIRRGDVIIRVGSRVIPEPNALLNHVALLAPGTWVEVEVLRGGKKLVFKAKVARRGSESAASRGGGGGSGGGAATEALGLGLETLTPSLRRDYGIPAGVAGALVSWVEEGSRAGEAGLQEGDVIVEANRAKVRGPRDVLEAARKAGKKGKLLLVVNRGGETFYAAL